MDLKIKDIQDKSWNSFVECDLAKAVSDSSEIYKESEYKVTFKLQPLKVEDASSGKYRECLKNNSSYTTPVVVNATVESRKSSDGIGVVSRDINVLTLPVYSPVGFIRNGKTYCYLSEVATADGWFLLEDRKTRRPILERRTRKGITIQILQDKSGNTVVQKLAGGDLSKKAVPLDVFMRAVFNRNLSSCSSFIGSQKSMNLDIGKADGISDDECVVLSYEAMQGDYGRKVSSYKAKIVLDKIINGQRSKQTDYSRKRLRLLASFVYRCTGMFLAESVYTGENTYSGGEMITRDIASELDRLSIGSVKVRKTLDISDKVYTVTKLIDNSYSENFSLEEFMTVLNVYYNNVEGFGIFHKERSLDNIILKTVSFKFCDEVTNALTKFKDQIDLTLSRESAGELTSIVEIAAKSIESKRETLMRKLNNEESFQPLEVVSELGKVTKGSKIRPEVGGANMSISNRAINDGERGRVCCNETPDGRNIGVVRTLAIYADVDDDYAITAPYFRVVNGVVDKSEVIRLPYIEEIGHFVAPADADMSKDLIECYLGKSIHTVPKEYVSYIECSVDQNFGVGVNATPFANMNSGRRNTMGANSTRQAVPVRRAQRPIVDCPVGTLEGYGVVKVSDIKEAIIRENNLTESWQIDEVNDGILKLETVTTNEDERVCWFNLIDSADDVTVLYDYRKSLETYRESEQGSMVHAKINSTIGGTWTKEQNDEVVIYSSDIDIKRHVIKTAADVPQSGNLGTALGLNLKVLYKFMDGCGIDDAIIIREGLLKEEKLSSAYVTVETISLEPTQKVLSYTPTNKIPDVNADDIKHLDSNGMPKIGTYIKVGQIIAAALVKKIGKNSINYTDSRMFYSKQSGYVISVSRIEDTVNVYLGGMATIERGDKLTGRHGNKGVISRLVADVDMPHLPDGTVVDIVLNPLGVPSRLNTGQLEESAVGMLGLKNDQIHIVNSYGDIKEYSANGLREAGLTETVVYDGRTGEAFPDKMFVGVQYMYKLEHMVSAKVHAVGNVGSNRNFRTQQPKEGKKNNGAQKMSENFQQGLVSAGAMKVLKEFSTAMSSDYKGSEKMSKAIGQSLDSFNQVGVNRSFEFLMPYFFALGIYMDSSKDGIRLEPLTDTIMRKLTDRILPVSDRQRNKDIIGAEIGLHTNGTDEKEEARAKFELLDFKHGVVMPAVLESSLFMNSCLVVKFVCGDLASAEGVYRNKLVNETEMKHLKFSVAPITEGQIKGLLGRKLGKSSRNSNNLSLALVNTSKGKLPILLTDDIQVTQLVNVMKGKFNRDTDLYSGGIAIEKMLLEYPDALMKDIAASFYKYCSFSREGSAVLETSEFTSVITDEIENEDGEVNEQLLRKSLKVVDIDSLHINLDVSSGNVMFDRCSAIKRSYDYLEEKKMKLKDFLVHYQVVIPASLRTKMEIKQTNSENKQYSYDDATTIYLDLMSELNTLNLRPSNLSSGLERLYKILMDANESEGYMKDSNGNVIASFKSVLIGKKGLFRDNTVAMRVESSGRSVIVPAPAIPTDSARVPRYIIAEVFRDLLSKELSSKIKDSYGLIARYWDVNSVFRNNYRADENPFKDIDVAKVKDITRALIQYVKTGNTVKLQTIVKCKELVALLVKDVNTIVNTKIAGRPVVIVREPAFHKFNCLAFKIIPTTDATVGIPPIAAAGYNADYDGDQTSLYFPMSEDAVKDAFEHLSPSVAYVNVKDNSVILALPQDIALGIYEMTSLYKNVKCVNDAKSVYEINGEPNIKLVPSVDKLKDWIANGIVKHYDIVLIKVSGRKYCSTAGRILLHCALPIEYNSIGVATGNSMGFTKNAWSNVLGLNVSDKFKEGVFELYLDSVINNKKLESIKNDVLKFTKDVRDSSGNIIYTKGVCALKTFDALKELGFQYSDKSGVTLSVFDYATRPDIAEMRSVVESKLGIIRRLREVRFITEKKKDAEITSLINGFRKSVQESSVKSLDRMNNLYRIFESGARAKESNICESIGTIGLSADANGKIYDRAIFGNYSDGLRAIDAVTLADATLAGSIATSLQTADTGYDGRKTRMLCQDMVITEDDCKAKSTNFVVYYKDAVNLDQYDKCELVDIDSNCLGFSGYVVNSKVALNRFKSLYGDCVKLDRVTKRFINNMKPRTITIINGEGVKEVVELKYSINKEVMNIILNHYVGENTTKLKLSQLKVSASETYTVQSLQAIEDMQLYSIPVRLISSCIAKDGICKTCFGIDSTTGKEVEMGKSVGYEAAAALHETYGQASLNSKNNGAERSSENSFDILIEMNSGKTAKATDDKTIMKTDQYSWSLQSVDIVKGDNNVVTIELMDRSVLIFNESDIKEPLSYKAFDYSLGNVISGDWVVPLQQIIDYLYVDLNVLEHNLGRVLSACIDSNWVEERKSYGIHDTDLIKSFLAGTGFRRYLTRYSNNYNPKMLEVASEAHHTLALVTKSSVKEFKVGCYYPYGELVQHNLNNASKVEFKREYLGCSKKLSRTDSWLSGVVYENIGKVFSKSLGVSVDKCRSVNSKLAGSVDLITGEKIDVINHYVDVVGRSYRSTKKFEDIVNEPIDVDLNDSFNQFEEQEYQEEVDYEEQKVVALEEGTDKNSDESNLKETNMFG